MNRITPRLFHLLLFASGGLALVYEVLWMRLFISVFGATTPATAATLAAVFLGLAVGSAFFGARAARFVRPLRAYGVLEMAAGASALLVEPLLGLYDRSYPALYDSLAQSPVLFIVLKVVMAMIALFLPMFCMGGTVPLLAHALTRDSEELGRVGSGLYAANTLGAALGALSVPFFWLPQLGATNSYLICVALNLVIGAVAWMLDRGTAAQTADRPTSRMKASVSRVKSTGVPRPWSLAGLAALSGALMFILQVAWTRMFAQVHENSIYSFAVVVAVFILGLAAGAAVVRFLLRRDFQSERLLGWAWLAGGATVAVVPHLFHNLTDGLGYMAQQGGWSAYAGRLVGLAAATMLVPALVAGMVLPLLMELAGRGADQPAGRVLGRLLAANTAGVIAGSLLAAFVLPAWLGLWATIAGAGLIMVVTGGLAPGESGRWNARRIVAAAIIIASIWWWNPAGLPKTKVRKSETLLAVREGSHGIAAVVEQPGSRRIKLDNFYVLGGTASLGDERAQAHIPLLLHPTPRHVAFLGLGTGISAGGALLHPIERATAVEIVPEVVEMAREHFAEANLGFITTSRTEVVIEDARRFLRSTGKQFDVIVGDLVVPWRRGESALYSAEHFAAARRALAPGGLFCQWIPMFQLSEEEFRIVTATFLDVFPRASLWRGDFAPNNPALALIGHAEDDAVLDPAAVARRVREMTADKANPQLTHEAGLWMYLVGPLSGQGAEFASAKRHRENRPWLELLAPLAHSAGRGERPVFVGRPLEQRLDRARSASLTGTVLASLSPDQTGWREAGRALADATLLLAEGRREESELRLRTAAALLPLEVRRTFLPAAPASR